MADKPIVIRTVIGGHEADRAEVLAWEARRLRKAAAKIGLPVPAGDLARQRLAFADGKLALGPEEIRRRLSRDVRLSDVLSYTLTGLSRGRRSLSICELHVSAGTAAEFLDWFDDTAREDYLRGMTAANPDHYLIGMPDDRGLQEVIETTGGGLAPMRFFIGDQDTSSLHTSRNPAFTHQAAGVAFAESGRIVGGLRHEFRDEPVGFHAHLCIEFPRFVPPRMIIQHRWHLACEWSNWAEFAFSGIG